MYFIQIESAKVKYSKWKMQRLYSYTMVISESGGDHLADREVAGGVGCKLVLLPHHQERESAA